MKIEIRTDITPEDLVKNYQNLGDDGVYAFDGKLEVRPAYQREFVYDTPKQVAVIDSIINDYPIGLMYIFDGLLLKIDTVLISW